MNSKSKHNPHTMRRFAAKTAIVTGGAGGMGNAICHRLASEGARVVIVDSNVELTQELRHSIQSMGSTAVACPLDLTAHDAGDAIAETALANGNSVDVLVNNAGIMRRGSLTDLRDEDWRSSFAVNIDAIYQICRALLPHMIKGGGGSVVNTASQWGLYPSQGHIAYATSKAAVVEFSRCMARDHAADGIRVNTVCPGEIHTRMLEGGLARSGRTVADLAALIPFGRVGTPEEVAALIAFLASDEAPYLTGGVVEITGAQPMP